MVDAATPTIERVSSDDRDMVLPALITLLQEVVAGDDASVGFLPPMSDEEARAFWDNVFEDVAAQTSVLLVARVSGAIVGTVQLGLATKPNARHRAEVQKLLVSPGSRGMGLGRRLMQEIERVARERGRTLLVLDTRQGDVAEQLYRKLGYVEVGAIPAFARNVAGTLDATVVFYKLLADDARPAD